LGRADQGEGMNKEEMEHSIKEIKRTAYNSGFEDGMNFIIKKCMADFLIGNDKTIEFPKSNAEIELTKEKE
jgi:hypothetical protein